MPHPLDALRACAGRWHGTSRLHDPHTGGPDDSASTLVVTPVVGGRFVRLDYTWAYGGAPQEGSLLVGYEPEGARATAHWADTWHLGDAALASVGTAGDDGALDVFGTYPAPTGPDWGWRTALRPGPHADGADTLHLVMHNVSPEGEAYPAVEAAYTRA